MATKRKLPSKTTRSYIKRVKKVSAPTPPRKEKTTFTPLRAELFCHSLATTALVSTACKNIGISRPTAYNWREEQPAFRTAWDKALKVGMSRLEDEGVRRAADGVKRAVYYKGDVVGHETLYSDTLLAFMLGAHDEKYRKARVEHTGADGRPLIPAEVRVRFVDAAPTKKKGK